MDEDQITALAREYAEEENPIESYSDTMFERALDLSISRGEALRVLTWLTRRFCLVEKSKVKQIYQAKQHILANQNVLGAIVATEAAAQKRLMLCLFPEIGKEVEG